MILFKDYLAKLNELAKENPESLELEVYYASDEEGNSYGPVQIEPSVMILSYMEYSSPRAGGAPSKIVCLN